VNHGHSWTEAYFPKKGWINLDATPFGSDTGDLVRDYSRSFLDWLDFVWYARIVNFDSHSQDHIVSGTTRLIANFFSSTVGNSGRLIAGFALTAILLLLVKKQLFFLLARLFRKRNARYIEQAQHEYGNMLRILARKGYPRKPSQTPYEFLRELQAKQVALLAEIKLITETFCAVRYGAVPTNPEAQEAIKMSLHKLKKGKL